MQQIKQMNGVIRAVRDITPTAREYTIVPEEPLQFTAGAFVNVFLEHNGVQVRRAFSLSSSDQDAQSFTLTIRYNPKGALTPLLWQHDYTGATVRLMGPLGLNTADKLERPRVFLFGFGVGAGVVKSLATHLVARPSLASLTIVTGSRSAEEIIHQDFFDHLSAEDTRVSVRHVVSDTEQTEYARGYIQEHISDYDFNHADVYICGQTTACAALEQAVRASSPVSCRFFIEDFH